MLVTGIVLAFQIVRMNENIKDALIIYVSVTLALLTASAIVSILFSSKTSNS